MDFEYLEEAGVLSISFNGRKLDAYTLGIVQLNLQEIIDKVASASLEKEGYIKRRPRRFRNQRTMLPYSASQIVKAEVKSISSGSLYEEICFLIPVVLADPNVRAVLQGLAANIVYSIGASGVRGLFHRNDNVHKNLPYRGPKDPDVGDNVRDIALVLAENSGGEITFKSKTPRGGEKEISVKINGYN